MQRVGPGTVLGGRYALRRRLSQDRELQRWSARDATLERDVTITIVGAEHANRAGLLDAARRAAGVEDTRLVRILDVGTQNDSSFIVEEAMSGSESLAALLLQGPLPAEEARRVAGETAQGLESARQRGLHHLRLTPHHVKIAADGAIRVGGVAVAAAMDGPDEQEPDAATASRRDTVRLVAVVYAALTSRWPLDETVSGLEAAPQVGDGVAAPSEIAAGVPRDLDALCRITLNESAGPLTPGELANRIAPWPRDRVPRGDVDPTVAIPLPIAGDVTEHVEIPGGELPERGVVPGSAEVTEGSPAIASGSEPTVAAMVGQDAAEAGAATDGEQTNEPNVPSGFASKFDPVEPPLPLLPGLTALPPSRGQSKIVVLVVALFVILALFIGYRGLLSPTSSPTVSKAEVQPPEKAVTTSAPQATVPPSPAPSKKATAAKPIAILSATGFDPEGDDQESDSKAGRVYDDDLATSWTSELYTTAEFGNLKKGVGVLLDLGQPTSVRQVTLDLGKEPVNLTVYAATDPSIEGATVIGKASEASERTKVKAAKSAKAQYVIVWFTRLAPDDGQFTATVSEIALS